MKINHYKLSVLLSIILLSLATFFYIYTTIFTPHGAYANSSAVVNGIGGGNITGDCQAGKKALPIYCVQTDKKQISISFDAAWGADDTVRILDVLDKHNVKTTFFMTGGWVSTYPDMSSQDTTVSCSALLTVIIILNLLILYMAVTTILYNGMLTLLTGKTTALKAL